jgi:hypothetical protein
MTYTEIVTAMRADWNYNNRDNGITRRWNLNDPQIPPRGERLLDTLTRTRSPEGRALLARLVHLATAGDHDAACVATLTILHRKADRCRSDGPDYVYRSDADGLPGAIWLAIINEPRPDRPYLRETIERRAWDQLRKANRDYRTITLTDDNAAARAFGDVANQATDSVAFTQLLDQLEQIGRLTPLCRPIIEHLAADTDIGTLDPDHRLAARTLATRRRRTLQRLRCAQIHQLLAA